MAGNEGECRLIEWDAASPNPMAKAVIGAAYEVSRRLGAGLLESVYERALIRELRLRDIQVSSQVVYPISYKGVDVGEYVADLVVEDEILVELNCADRFSDEHRACCLNYLKASQLRQALWISFRDTKVEWKRIVAG